LDGLTHLWQKTYLPTNFGADLDTDEARPIQLCFFLCHLKFAEREVNRIKPVVGPVGMLHVANGVRFGAEIGPTRNADVFEPHGQERENVAVNPPDSEIYLFAQVVRNILWRAHPGRMRRKNISERHTPARVNRQVLLLGMQELGSEQGA
jgi:hypothetical protein